MNIEHDGIVQTDQDFYNFEQSPHPSVGHQVQYAPSTLLSNATVLGGGTGTMGVDGGVNLVTAIYTRILHRKCSVTSPGNPCTDSSKIASIGQR